MIKLVSDARPNVVVGSQSDGPFLYILYHLSESMSKVSSQAILGEPEEGSASGAGTRHFTSKVDQTQILS